MVKHTEDERDYNLGYARERETFSEAAKVSACIEKCKQLNRALLAIFVAFCCLTAYGVYEMNYLKESVESLNKKGLEEKSPDEDKVYVYNMEDVLMQTGLAEENRKFESDMAALEKEINKAEKKVRSMKDKKLQKEYREMYMKSLTLKRDNIVSEHEKFMKSLLKNTNKALAETVKENNIKVIFNNKAVIFSTNYVTDVTPIVAEKLKAEME